MDRTQKKCFVGVTVMHALPLLIAVIGTAFFNKQPEATERPQILELVDPVVTDGPTRPSAAAAMTAVPEAKPVEVPKPVSAPPPEPVREKVVEPPAPKIVEKKPTVSELPVPDKKPEAKEVPKPVEKVVAKPAPPKPTRNIDISKPIVRNNADQKTAADEAKKNLERANNERIAALKKSLNRLGKNLSSSTTIDLQGASSDAGAVNYADLVLKKYDDAWTAPNEVDDNEAIVKAKVVIARSGSVISADIIRASGNAVLDQSVRRALGLRFIHPFPEGSKDSQRTYIINFNLKTKRGIG